MAVRPARSHARTALAVAALSAHAMLAACGGDATAPEPVPPAPTEDPVRVAWLAGHAHALASIEPEHRDFRDLEPLREAIGDARIVMLGEQTHGDGTTFLAKVRLVQFLHEELGFDVLAWESGFYDLHLANEQLLAGGDAVAAQRTAVRTLWTRSEQVQPLFAYVAARGATDHPLEIAGFDPQATSRAPNGAMQREIEDLVSRIGFTRPSEYEWLAFLEIAEGLSQARETPATTGAAQRQAFQQVLGSLVAAARQYLATHDDAQVRWWAQLFESMAVQASIAWRSSTTGMPVDAGLLRDAQMADNLAWLAEDRYAGRRIIVWAASFHILRDLSTLQVPEAMQELYAGGFAMGEKLHPRFGTDAYVLGFTAYEGGYGQYYETTPHVLSPAAPGSLESLFHHAGFENAFLDLRGLPADGAWLRAPLSARVLGHSAMVGEWPRALDGIVYTRRMEPSRPLAP